MWLNQNEYLRTENSKKQEIIKSLTELNKKLIHSASHLCNNININYNNNNNNDNNNNNFNLLNLNTNNNNLNLTSLNNNNNNNTHNTSTYNKADALPIRHDGGSHPRQPQYRRARPNSNVNRNRNDNQQSYLQSSANIKIRRNPESDRLVTPLQEVSENINFPTTMLI